MLGMLVDQMVGKEKPIVTKVTKPKVPLCPMCPPKNKQERMLLSTGRRSSYCKLHNKEFCRKRYVARQLKLKGAGL